MPDVYSQQLCLQVSKLIVRKMKQRRCQAALARVAPDGVHEGS
jgi:hypothetical protein